MKSKVLSVLLAVLLLCGAVPIEASAVDQEEESPVEVATLTELLSAIDQAEAGDTIIVTQTINVNQSCMIGSTEKPLILKGEEGVSTFLSFSLNWGFNSSSWLSGLTIDGEVAAIGSKVEINTPCSVYINDVNFINCQGLYGGAINIMEGNVFLGADSFKDCSAICGGAVCVQGAGVCYPGDSTFEGNTATENGGALYVAATCYPDGCTFSGNQAQKGGAVYSTGVLTLNRNKIHNNLASVAGADVFSAGTLSIAADDYSTFFAEELTAGGYNTLGWYKDTEEDRSKVEAVEMPLEGVMEETALAFVMSTVEPEPEPTPTPTPSPAPSTDTGGSGGHYTPYTPTVTPTPVEPDPVVLSCNEAVLDKDAAESLIAAVGRFIPSEKVVTRGEAASLIYGLLTADSKTACKAAQGDFYADIATSPYRESINALTAATVFCGCSEGCFAPDLSLSMAQLITLFSRFTEPQDAPLKYAGVEGHWAEKAVKTAVAMGWIEDTQLDLSTPVTYGMFTDFLTSIYG